jgi:hypothetical protein
MLGKHPFSGPHPHGFSLNGGCSVPAPFRLGKTSKSLTMPMHPEPKQPKRVLQGNPRSAAESDFKMAPSDTECLQQALREYREASWDDAWF